MRSQIRSYLLLPVTVIVLLCTVVPAAGQANILTVRFSQWIGRGILYGYVWSPDSRYLAVESASGIWVHDIDAPSQPSYHLSDYAVGVSFSPDSKEIAYSVKDGVVLWDTQSHEPAIMLPLTTTKGWDERTMNFTFGLDDRILTAYNFNGLWVWDVDQRAEIAYFDHGYRPIFNSGDYSMAFMVRSEKDDTNKLVLWNPFMRQYLPIPSVFDKSNPSAVQFSAGGQLIVVCYAAFNYNDIFCLWAKYDTMEIAQRLEVNDGKVGRPIEFVYAVIGQLAFTPDDSALLAVNGETVLRFDL